MEVPSAATSGRVARGQEGRARVTGPMAVEGATGAVLTVQQ
jgi:hypothetical protein